MLGISDRPIEPVIEILAQNGIEAGYLVPTTVGLEKSILDAHGGLKDYFHISEFHDYVNQSQGVAGKKIVQGFFVTPKGLESTQVSLYRPETKSGDARIWIYGLKDKVKAGNLLIILAHKNALYVINASDRVMLSNAGLLHTEFYSVIQKITESSNSIAMELLGRLKVIAGNGWITSLKSGPTGVGFTIEEMLGIPANNKKTPDYKGIEIKAGRRGLGGEPLNRTTLFSKTPNWKQSKIGRGLELLDSYGYRVEERLQLYCSLSNTPNTLGHYLEVQDDDSLLHAMHKTLGANPKISNVLLWDMGLLRSVIAKKHKETFWVKANVKRDKHGVEEFHYTEAVHTKGPLLGNVVEMFRLGRIQLDYLIHEDFNKKGKRKSRDHGYLFKMWERNLPSLFPPAKTYLL